MLVARQGAMPMLLQIRIASYSIRKRRKVGGVRTNCKRTLRQSYPGVALGSYKGSEPEASIGSSNIGRIHDMQWASLLGSESLGDDRNARGDTSRLPHTCAAMQPAYMEVRGGILSSEESLTSSMAKVRKSKHAIHRNPHSRCNRKLPF